jgi:flagellar biosynthetic protein FlhB
VGDSNKTEKPTPHRREKARKQGQVTRSRDVSSAMALAGAGAALLWQGPKSLTGWQDLLRRSLDLAVTDQITTRSPVLWLSALEILRDMVPMLTAGLTMALAAGVMQGGMVFSGEALIPKAERLSPGKKLQQMFSLTGLSGLLKSLLPFGAIVYVAIRVLQAHWQELLRASFVGLPSSCARLFAILLELGWKSTLILLLWSGVDYFLAWRKMEGELRMSRQELREDFKETEGHPEIKARIRKIQRSLRRQQLLRATETATVVVTNPTHYAVALRYELEMEVPIVVAKGCDLLAIKIKEVARWHEIPIMENPPLAQALYKTAEVGQAIPAKLYAAVAEILVMVYRTQTRVRQAQGSVC